MDDVHEGLEVIDEDWYGQDLCGGTFVRCRFVDVDMTEVRTTGVRFDECVFTGVRLNASVHSASAFTTCRVERSNLFGATFTGCKLTGTTFTGTALSRVTVQGGSWAFASLRGADLKGSRFTGVSLREADLAHVSADEVVLTDVDLTGAELTGARLNRADLRGSLLGDLDPRVVEVRGAVVDVAQALHLAGTLGLDVR